MSGLESYIRSIPDFPKKGIIFKDITTLLQNSEGFYLAIEELSNHIDPEKTDRILGIESRGFIFSAALAYKFKKGLVPVRKPGKLPFRTLKKEYALEYGTDSIEMHVDAVSKGDRVVIVDDLLATGGTASAAASIVEEAGGIVESIIFLIELDFLRGRDKLKSYNVISLIHVESE